MPIKVKCSCGAAYDVPDEWAGRKGRCKRCKSPIAIPTVASAADFEVVEDEPDVVDDVFEVVSEEKSSERPEPKRKKKKKRQIDPEVRRLIEEEREEKRRHRRAAIVRGWAYMSPGIALILLGIGLIVVCVHFEGQGEIDQLPDSVHFFYKLGGAWVPGIVSIIAGLVPLTLGILNLMGISILVAAWEEDDD